MRATMATGLFLTLGTVFLKTFEKEHIKTLKDLNEGIASVTEAKLNHHDPNLNGKIVYLNGPVRNDIAIQDFFYEVTTNSLALYRTVEMYQWEENNHKRSHHGSKYTYELRWSEELISSSNFNEPGHTNPPELPIRSQLTIARELRIGDYTLSPSYHKNLKNRKKINPDQINSVPTLNGKTGTITNDYIYYGDPSNPQVGDIRVTIEVIPSENMSLIGLQNSNKTIQPFTTKNGETYAPLEVGNLAPNHLFKIIEEKASLKIWVIRLLTFVSIFIAFRNLALAFVILSRYIPAFGKFDSVSNFAVGLFLALPYFGLVIAHCYSVYLPQVSYGIYAAIFVFYIIGVFKFKSRVKKGDKKFSNVARTMQPKNTAPKSIKINSPHTKFIIYDNGNTYGPYSSEKILKQLDKGKITLMTQVCPVGSKDFLRVADLLRNSKKAA